MIHKFRASPGMHNLGLSKGEAGLLHGIKACLLFFGCLWVGAVGKASATGRFTVLLEDSSAVSGRSEPGPLAETIFYEASDSLTVDFGITDCP